MAKKTMDKNASSTANLGFEQKLWLTADKLRFGELIDVIAFYRTVRPFDLMRAANDRETRTLATLRDTLLPKLLSGELSVAGLEKETAL